MRPNGPESAKTTAALYAAADSLAPFCLSKEMMALGHHDNSGLLLDCGSATRVLCALDLSSAAVDEAQKCGADCIFTHHPAIYHPIYALEAGSPLLRCAQAGISVFSSHLNLDCAEGGIDEELMRGLGGKEALRLSVQLSCGGYGRLSERNEAPMSAFTAEIAEKFRTNRLVVYGNRPVRRIASFCGAGLDGAAVSFALENGADTVVSSDAAHHNITALADAGVNLVLLPHYTAEIYGFARFAQRLGGRYPAPVSLFCDGRYL